MNNLKINKIFKIILFIILLVNIINAYNPLKIYTIKQWQYQNCTGTLYEFLSFSEDQLYSSIMGAHFDCDPNYLNGTSVNCKMTVNEFKQSDNKMTLELTQGICNNGKSLEYQTKNDFNNYLNGDFNVITEYGNEFCKFNANFYLGILDNSCVYGWLIKRVNGYYEIQKCHSNDYNNAFNYTTNPSEYFEKLTILNNLNDENSNSYCLNSIIDTKPSNKGYRIISKLQKQEQQEQQQYEGQNIYELDYDYSSSAITISINLILLLISIILTITF